MQLSLRNFATLVEQSAAAVQANVSQILDFSAGSVLRAILEANASVALWLQWLILLVLQTARLATSSGTDADSFGADFGFTRLPAVAAQGAVTFSRYSPSQPTLIPVGTLISTSDGVTQFSVVADAANAAWSASLNGYMLGIGVASITTPVAAIQLGAMGNVLPNTITLLSSPIAGVDTVVNATALTGGVNAEPDAAFRSRFQGFMDSRSRATVQAITYAVLSLQQNLSCTILENTDVAGMFSPGTFVVTVDDGSGSPPASLLSNAQAAVESVRPVGSTFALRGPTKVVADISLTLVLAPGADAGATSASVSAAVSSFVNALPVGAGLSYTRLAQLAYDSSANVQNVVNLTLQGSSQDLSVSITSVIRLGTLAINT
jgi:phage-related baseplate assembly protein